MNASYLAFELSASHPFGFPIRAVWKRANDETNNRLIRPDLNWKHWDPETTGIDQMVTEADLHTAGDSAVDLIDRLNQELYEQTVYTSDLTVSKHSLKLLCDAAERQLQFEICELPSEIQRTCNQSEDAETQLSAVLGAWKKAYPTSKSLTDTDRASRPPQKRPIRRSKKTTRVVYRRLAANDTTQPKKDTGEFDYIDALAKNMKANDDDRYYSLSTAEQLYIALASNRLDLIQAQGETIASALGRIGKDWREHLVERHRYL